MKISLKEEELVQAIRNYIAGQGISVLGKELKVEISKTKKPTSYRASVDITKSQSEKKEITMDEAMDTAGEAYAETVAKETPVPTPQEESLPELPKEDGNKMEEDFTLGSKVVEDAVEEVDQIIDTAAKEEVPENEKAISGNDVENLFA